MIIAIVLQFFLVQAAPVGFADQHFTELLEKNPKGLVYVWTPHIEESAKEVAALAQAQLGYPVTVLVDPQAEPRVLAQVAQKYKLPAEYLRPALARQLYEGERQFPVTVFYLHRKVRMRIPGLQGPELKETAQLLLR